MAKYINADEFLMILDTMGNPDSEFATDDYTDGFSDGVFTVMGKLDNYPAADVAPVRHGHWYQSFYLGDEITCSKCSATYNIFETDGAENFDYCPHCGARMDGKNND